jgi:glycerophosphoryl diester phosphodiesterase
MSLNLSARRPARARVRPHVRAAVVACAALLVTTLPASPAAAAGVNLHRGSHGAKVRLLESRLHRLDLLVASAVDGRYRQATVNAVKRFQRQHHTSPTGRVNRRTWVILAREVARRANPPVGPAPSVIGHRGAMRPGLAENTLESLRYAHGWANVLEFDLRLTSDREIVLMHDATLNRTTNCAGLVSSWTLADLRAQCRVGDQPIPTLEEVAAYASSVPEPIAPELKNPTFSNEDINRVLAILDHHDLTRRTFMQSFTSEVLQRVHAIRPGLTLVLASTNPPSVPAVKDAGATRVAVDMTRLTAPRVRLYKRNGLKVWTFTALDKAGLVTARSLGVTAVVTDIPRQARNLYK